MLRKAFPWLQDKPERGKPGEVVIKGEKVVLREKRIEDAPDDYAWRTDEELARLDATRPIPMSYETFLRHSKDEIAYSNVSSRRLAIDTLDGRHIGNCMYYDINLKRGEVELGIMIDRNYWSQGYGSDSIGALLRYIFTTTPLNRVYLHTLDWNHRGRRSFAKAGLREVKNVRRSGMDFVLMEILRDDWESKARRDESSDHHQDPGGEDGAQPHDAGTAPAAEQQ